MAPALLIFASVLGLCSIDIHTLSTDEYAELFTCASLRGQVPVIMGLERGSNAEKTKKIWIAQKLIGQVGHLSLRAENMITWLLRTGLLFFETSSKICFLKLTLVTYPSNVFQITANRFGPQT